MSLVPKVMQFLDLSISQPISVNYGGPLLIRPPWDQRIREVVSFQGGTYNQVCIVKPTLKWPEYRGGHI